MKINPCAKINLGLNIVGKRPDGYHNLQTVFYPVPLFDTLEIVEADETRLFVNSSLADEDPERNLVVRAYRLLEKSFQLPPVHIHLQKSIPMQAGMGGGSSDGAYTLRLLNDLFHLQLSTPQLQQMAAGLGADCPFFIEATPAYGEGIGEQLSPIALDLSGLTIVVVKPPIAVSTREAFALIHPQLPARNCRDIVMQPIATWRESLANDFEQSIFAQYPEIAAIKHSLYDHGALYAAMSGSGSSVFGLFDGRPQLPHYPDSYAVYAQQLQQSEKRSSN